MDDVSIQIATKDDLDDLIKYLSLDVIDNSFVKPLSQRSISIYDRVYKYFNNGYWIVLKYNNKINGCISMILNGFNAELSTFSVHPDLRNKHLGERLMIETEIIIKELFPEIQYIYLDSWEGNMVIKHILSSLGYNIYKIFKDDNKRPVGINTVIYVKKLIK